MEATQGSLLRGVPNVFCHAESASPLSGMEPATCLSAGLAHSLICETLLSSKSSPNSKHNLLSEELSPEVLDLLETLGLVREPPPEKKEKWMQLKAALAEIGDQLALITCTLDQAKAALKDARGNAASLISKLKHFLRSLVHLGPTAAERVVTAAEAHWESLKRSRDKLVAVQEEALDVQKELGAYRAMGGRLVQLTPFGDFVLGQIAADPAKRGKTLGEVVGPLAMLHAGFEARLQRYLDAISELEKQGLPPMFAAVQELALRISSERGEVAAKAEKLMRLLDVICAAQFPGNGELSFKLMPLLALVLEMDTQPSWAEEFQTLLRIRRERKSENGAAVLGQEGRFRSLTFEAAVQVALIITTMPGTNITEKLERYENTYTAWFQKFSCWDNPVTEALLIRELSRSRNIAGLLKRLENNRKQMAVKGVGIGAELDRAVLMVTLAFKGESIMSGWRELLDAIPHSRGKFASQIAPYTEAARLLLTGQPIRACLAAVDWTRRQLESLGLHLNTYKAALTMAADVLEKQSIPQAGSERPGLG